MGLVDAISTIEASDTIDELSSSLHRIVQNYGFSGFAFVDAGRPDLDLPYHVGTYPDAWKRATLSGFLVNIPLVGISAGRCTSI